MIFGNVVSSVELNNVVSSTVNMPASKEIGDAIEFIRVTLAFSLILNDFRFPV